MKLVIEVDQANENTAPVVTLKVDDRTIGVIESLEFLTKSDMRVPKCMIRFPDLNKLMGPHMAPEARAALAPLVQSIAQSKNMLKFFRWIDMP